MSRLSSSAFRSLRPRWRAAFSRHEACAEFQSGSAERRSIAHLLTKAGADSATVTNCGFVLLAPAARIAEGAFAALDKVSIARAVEERATSFDSDAAEWRGQTFRPILDRCKVTAMAWESVLAEITAIEPIAGEGFLEFYSQCLRYNPLLPAKAAV